MQFFLLKSFEKLMCGAMCRAWQQICCRSHCFKDTKMYEGGKMDKLDLIPQNFDFFYFKSDFDGVFFQLYIYFL